MNEGLYRDDGDVRTFAEAAIIGVRGAYVIL